MAAAPTLAATVNALRWLATGVLVVCCCGVQAATQVLVVSGLGGDAQYDKLFQDWSAAAAKASATVAGEERNLKVLSGAAAQANAVEKALQELATNSRGADAIVVLLIGHGSFDGNDYRLNLPGPDLTGARLGVLLDRLPQAVPQLVVNATSASGAVADKWSRAGRSVITATRTGGERNATRFAAYWVEALATEEADRDRNGSITAAEAYDYASRKVAESFKSDASMATEHSRLGGGDAARIVVARVGKAAKFAGDAELVALRSQQSGVETRLAEVKSRKSTLAVDDYYRQLEPVLLDMARVARRIDARESQLDGNRAAEGGNATR